MKRLVVSVLLVGCGGDGSGGTIDLDNLGTELAVASCSKQFECCTDAEIMQQYMGITYEGEPISTEDQCVAFTNAIFSGVAVVQYKESIAMGRIEYDGAAAADCLAALENLSCAQYSTGELGGLAPACRPFVIPKVADGGGCTHDDECTSDKCEGATSEPGGPSTDGMCKPKPTAGQSCEDDCADGLYCGFELPSGMEVCQATKADGMQCSLDRECTSDYCDDATRMCATEPPTCDGR